MTDTCATDPLSIFPSLSQSVCVVTLALLTAQWLTMVQTMLPFYKPLSQAAVDRRAQNNT